MPGATYRSRLGRSVQCYAYLGEILPPNPRPYIKELYDQEMKTAGHC